MPGQVDNACVRYGENSTFLFLDGYAGKVADMLVTAGEIVEQRAFAAVLVADEGEMQLHASLTSDVTVIFAASSARSVSS